MSKLSFEVSFGPSFPLGLYGSKASNLLTGPKKNGWATTGIAMNLGMNYRVSKSFGLSLMLEGQKNEQDPHAMESNYGILGDSVTAHAAKQSWKIGKVLAGGWLGLPTGWRSSSFRLKFLGGLLKTTVPGYHVTYFTISSNGFPYGSARYGSGYSLPWTFCYEANIDFRYPLARKLDAFLGAGYSHANPVREGNQYINTTPPQWVEMTFHYPISVINMQVGLELSL